MWAGQPLSPLPAWFIEQSLRAFPPVQQQHYIVLCHLIGSRVSGDGVELAQYD